MIFQSKCKCGVLERNARECGLCDGGGRGRERGPRVFESGMLRYLVLQRIAEQPRHGYEIIKAIEEASGGSYIPSPGMIYPMLSMLEDLGYLDVVRQGNRKLHSITSEGRVFLHENRAFAEAVEARITSRRVSCSGVVRTRMQALKEALATRVLGQNLSGEQLEKVDAILRKAAADIQSL